MRNNSLSLLTALCLSTAFIVTPVWAQKAPKQVAPAVTAKAQPAEKNAAVDAEKEKQSKDLEAELSNTDVDSAKILDFPSRTSLGDLEMATLPGINEAMITGPASMAPSVSTKDMPSEQLLGRITSEVFQEMADLERGNVFLKLQMQKEQLKNDLERLKATYRQTRLEEIAKREDVVRSRINWWQEQENVRLEMEKKKAETEAVEQQIAEAEELRNKLRAEALAEKDVQATQETPASDSAEETGKEKPVEIVRAVDIYDLIAIKGVKGDLSARLKKRVDGQILTVKADHKLPDGMVIEEVLRDSIVIRTGDRKETLLFNVIPAEESEVNVTVTEE